MENKWVLDEQPHGRTDMTAGESDWSAICCQQQLQWPNLMLLKLKQIWASMSSSDLGAATRPEEHTVMFKIIVKYTEQPQNENKLPNIV